MPVGLLALALGGFGIGLTEFVIAGLLTPVANDLGVSVPTAGYLVSGYALAVVFGALALPPLLAKWAPKRALLLLMVLFVVGNAISALAPATPRSSPDVSSRPSRTAPSSASGPCSPRPSWPRRSRPAPSASCSVG